MNKVRNWPGRPYARGNLGIELQGPIGPDRPERVCSERGEIQFRPERYQSEEGWPREAGHNGSGPRAWIKLAVFRIHQRLPKGEAVTVEFTADWAGTFPFECSAFCGLIVE
jgi:hypothetical protein